MQGSNLWLTFAIREGKNREVRNVLGHLGLAVTRLIRVSFGPFQLGELAEGAVEEVRTRVLREQLGEKLVGLSRADFPRRRSRASPRQTRHPSISQKPPKTASPISLAAHGNAPGQKIAAEVSWRAPRGETQPHRATAEKRSDASPIAKAAALPSNARAKRRCASGRQGNADKPGRQGARRASPIALRTAAARAT